MNLNELAATLTEQEVELLRRFQREILAERGEEASRRSLLAGTIIAQLRSG